MRKEKEKKKGSGQQRRGREEEADYRIVREHLSDWMFKMYFILMTLDGCPRLSLTLIITGCLLFN